MIYRNNEESLIGSMLGKQYLEALTCGDRSAARQLMERLLASEWEAADLLSDLVWPAMERLQTLYKDDVIERSALNLATRLNRLISDQLSARLKRAASNGKKVLIFCGNDEPEELGGQICAELFEAGGYEVKFAGGGVPKDEVLKLIGEYRPELLVLFATLPAGMPEVRQLIDYLREVNSCPNMQIMCCGGIYKRAEGLAEEIGADLSAPDAREAVRVAGSNPSRKATAAQQTVGRSRRVRAAAEVATNRRPVIMARIGPSGPLGKVA